MRSCFTARLLLSTFLATSAAVATERVDGPQDQTFRGTPGEAALAYLRSERGPEATRGVRLETKALLRGVGATTVRFEQTHQGLPVLGAATAVRIGDDGRVHFTTTNAARGVTVAVKPSLSAQEAEALVASLVGLDRSKAHANRLAVQPGDETTPEGYLVWEVDASSRLGGERFLVDAHRGRLVGRRALALDILGRVYKVSSKETPTPSDEPLLDLDEASPRKLNAYKGMMSVYEYQSGGQQSPFVGSQNTVANSGEDFLFDPPSSKQDQTDAFAVVNSFYHIHRIREFYGKTLGVDMSSGIWSLAVLANARDGGAPMDNAFYSQQGLSEPYHPNLIAIGQGSNDFSYDSDVFMHEFTHYASQNAIGYNEGQLGTDTYGISPFGGSIDEGIADYFACTVNGDPQLGEAVLGSSSRDLSYDDGRRCPDGLFGEVHEDGKIIGNVSWKIRELLGAEIADQLIWGGSSMLNKGASLQNFADNVTKVAEEMVTAGKLTSDQLGKIKAIFDERGLYDCGRVLSLNVEERKMSQFGLDQLGQYFGAGCNQLKKFLELSSPFHVSYTPEANAKKIRFEVQVDSFFGGGGLDWRLLVRKGKAVTFKSSQNGFPEPSKFDIEFESTSAEFESFEIGEGTPYELDPTATYYAVVVHTNCPYTQLSFSAFSDDGSTNTAGTGGAAGSAGAAAGGKGGAGGTGVGGSISAGQGGAGGLLGASGGPNGNSAVEGVVTPEGGDGCGCRVAGSSSPRGASLGGLALALALVSRRSRRGQKALARGLGGGALAQSWRMISEPSPKPSGYS